MENIIIMVDMSSANDSRYDTCYTVYETGKNGDVVSHGFVADKWNYPSEDEIRKRVKAYYPDLIKETTPVEFGCSKEVFYYKKG